MKRCIEWGGLALVALVTAAGPVLAQPSCTDSAAAAQSGRIRISNEAILGSGNCHDAVVVAVGSNGGAAEFNGANGSRKLAIKASGSDSSVLLRPSAGTWDLRDDLQVLLKVRNTGTATATVSGRAESKEGNTPWSAPIDVAPGASATLAIPFQAPTVELGNSGVAAQFASDLTTGIALRVGGSGSRSIAVDEVRASAPAPAPLPDWLGKRPPVPGNWTMTLNENFDGNALDATHWSVTGTNYWDKVSHFSKQNVTVANGHATLRFERRHGHANDDPAQPETDYTTGFLTSVGKWSQRYGYFEARVKLPKAPGLWPAVWMMPDRGPQAKGDRQSTSDGGMEYDFIEYLTRFGPNRYNVALHWDGYGADHKKTGDDGIYVQPDAEGYVVAGLLWQPGSVAFYANGKEMARRSDPRIGNVPSYLLVTLIAGGWGGNDLTGAGLPDELVVDWIHAWSLAGQ
jgi:hypothetical protein